MEQRTHGIEVSFRFLKLDRLQAVTLEREVPDSTYQPPSNENHYVGRVLLTEHNMDAINDFYVRQRVSLDECDIFVSSVTENASPIIDVPRVVNQMLKYIDCKLTYSITVA